MQNIVFDIWKEMYNLFNLENLIEKNQFINKTNLKSKT